MHREKERNCKTVHREEERNCKTVFSARMARALLREGFEIADIKPDKLDEDRKRSLFLFKKAPGLRACMERFSREDWRDDNGTAVTSTR